MDIKGKVHCFFEQSGTFKNEFIKLGIPAEDYDIQNNFGQTDNVIDLFSEIDKEYAILQRERERERTIFTDITQDDLIVAFYPCIYFCASSQMNLVITSHNNRNMETDMLFQSILKRVHNREEYYIRLIKFCYIAKKRGIRLIIENPWSEQTYLKANFIKKPSVIDMNRMERGDYFKKPTAYWFWNCEPTNGFTHQNDKTQKVINSLAPSKQAGICNEERSMISTDYARNWICDFILGKYQEDISEPTLFDINEYIK